MNLRINTNFKSTGEKTAQISSKNVKTEIRKATKVQ